MPPIVLFNGGRDGAGHAIASGQDGYHWAINIDCRSGAAVPLASFQVDLLNATLTTHYNGAPITAAFEWEDTSGRPILVVAGGGGTANAYLYVMQNGVVTANVQSIDRYTGGVLWKYDQDPTADADEEMAFFCNGNANDVLVRRKKDGTVDTGATATHTMKADGLWAIGPDLYATQGYKILKLNSDTDPGIAANYATGVPVGRPTWDINAVLNLGGSPIVCKPEGAFKNNPATGDYDPLFSVAPHPDNGKGAFTDGRGRIYYPTVDGDLIVVTFGFASAQTPFRVQRINRDTVGGRITAGTADLDHVYIPIEGGSQRAPDGLGLVVKSEDGGVFTTHTTAVTDGSYSTVADVSLLTNNGVDFIWIGSTSEPFLGAYIKLASSRTTGALTAQPIAPSFGISGGSYQAATALDGTGYFSQDGAIIMYDNTAATLYADLLQTGISSNVWAKTTVNGVEAYWMRLEPNGGALTGVNIREVSLIPYRPPLDTGLFPITAYKQGGAAVSVLVGTWQGEDIVWHDVWTPPRQARIEQLVVGRSAYTSAQSERSLYAVGLQYIDALPIGFDGDNARRPWPDTDGSFAQGGHVIAYSAWNFGAPATVRTVVVEGEYAQQDDRTPFYYRWDTDPEWRKSDPDGPFPHVIHNLEGRGRKLYTASAFSDATRDAVAPRITRVVIPEGEWTVYEDDFGGPMGVEIESPQSH